MMLAHSSTAILTVLCPGIMDSAACAEVISSARSATAIQVVRLPAERIQNISAACAEVITAARSATAIQVVRLLVGLIRVNSAASADTIRTAQSETASPM